MRDRDGEVGVDRIFRYADLPVFVDFLSDRLGERIHLGAVNVSPSAALRLPSATRTALRLHPAPEYAIYDGKGATSSNATGSTPVPPSSGGGRR